jgi:transposase
MDGLRGNVVPHRMPQVHLLVVSMQSTGVYWIPLYDILEERGFEVYLVNARHTPRICRGAKAMCKSASGC